MSFDKPAKKTLRFFAAKIFVCLCSAVIFSADFCAFAPAATEPVMRLNNPEDAKNGDLLSQSVSLDLRDMDIVDVLKFLSL